LGSTAASVRWLLPEGSTATPFKESVHLYNPGNTEANVQLALAPTSGNSTSVNVRLLPRSVQTVDLNANIPGRHLALRATSDAAIVLERKMVWNRGVTSQVGIPE
jgi:hypothetical protein